MDVLETIMTRQSCREFLEDAVEESTILTLIAAAVQAPSPLNGQPWTFTVVTRADVKKAIAAEAFRYREELVGVSNWKWLIRYDLAMLQKVPVMIVVAGDPSKSGADTLMEGAGSAWRDACAAAIENLMIAAAAEGLGTLWFTMFNRASIKTILGSSDATTPVAVILLGKPAAELKRTPRKSVADVVTFIR